MKAPMLGWSYRSGTAESLSCLFYFKATSFNGVAWFANCFLLRVYRADLFQFVKQISFLYGSNVNVYTKRVKLFSFLLNANAQSGKMVFVYIRYYDVYILLLFAITL